MGRLSVHRRNLRYQMEIGGVADVIPPGVPKVPEDGLALPGDVRYAFLRQAAGEAGADLIATAHTASDNVETILFHLARGSGLRGLGGILPKREEIIRPLLTTTRPQVEDYLRRHSLPHMEDSSNQNDAS